MSRMVSKTGLRRRRVSWGVLLSLVGYFLNLCTVCPFVHADILRQLGPGQSSVPEHCKRPPSATFPSLPFTADQGTTPEPLCCEFRDGQNKALLSVLAPLDFFPLVVHSLLPPDTALVNGGVQSLHSIHALHSFRPPPLYLVYAAFLL